MRHPSRLAAAALAVVAITAAGCGSSSNSSSSGTTQSSTSAANAPSTATTPAAAANTATTPAAGTGAAVVVSTKHDKLGTILAVGAKHMTVYLFEKDKGGGASCTGTCAQVWPPVTTAATVSTSGAAVASDLGTITRPDGTKQVTYKGHPLYFFARDKDSGDAYGQGVVGFGASWYVLSPSGQKIDSDGGGGASKS